MRNTNGILLFFIILRVFKNLSVRYKRWIYLAATFLIILAGLASRRYSDLLPEFIAAYAGDTLWAAMVYLGLRFLFVPVSVMKTGIASLLFSYGIEFSQLYQADWANMVRSNTLGALIFGHGFLWSDMICYTIGILVCVAVDYSIEHRTASSNT